MMNHRGPAQPVTEKHLLAGDVLAAVSVLNRTLEDAATGGITVLLDVSAKVKIAGIPCVRVTSTMDVPA